MRGQYCCTARPHCASGVYSAMYYYSTEKSPANDVRGTRDPWDLVCASSPSSPSADSPQDDGKEDREKRDTRWKKGEEKMLRHREREGREGKRERKKERGESCIWQWGWERERMAQTGDRRSIFQPYFPLDICTISHGVCSDSALYVGEQIACSLKCTAVNYPREGGELCCAYTKRWQ